jgi:hypothetical protein
MNWGNETEHERTRRNCFQRKESFASLGSAISLFERLKLECSFALGAIREVNSMKTCSLLLCLFLALAVAPAFGNSVTLYAPAPNSGGLSSDWGMIASCSCFGGYWQNSAVNGKYYGDLISQG